jgi:hypothetical protein
MSLAIVAAVTLAGSAVLLMPTPSAYADANCEQANPDRNSQGHARGNPKQCIFFEAQGEQPRSCNSPNAAKNNDGDALVFCVLRGN